MDIKEQIRWWDSFDDLCFEYASEINDTLGKPLSLDYLDASNLYCEVREAFVDIFTKHGVKFPEVPTQY